MDIMDLGPGRKVGLGSGFLTQKRQDIVRHLFLSCIPSSTVGTVRNDKCLCANARQAIMRFGCRYGLGATAHNLGFLLLCLEAFHSICLSNMEPAEDNNKCRQRMVGCRGSVWLVLLLLSRQGKSPGQKMRWIADVPLK